MGLLRILRDIKNSNKKTLQTYFLVNRRPLIDKFVSAYKMNGYQPFDYMTEAYRIFDMYNFRVSEGYKFAAWDTKNESYREVCLSFEKYRFKLRNPVLLEAYIGEGDLARIPLMLKAHNLNSLEELAEVAIVLHKWCYDKLKEGKIIVAADDIGNNLVHYDISHWGINNVSID